MEKTEQLALAQIDRDSEAMKRSVSNLDGPQNKMSASPFTERGLAQYFGEEDDGYLEFAPPHVSSIGDCFCLLRFPFSPNFPSLLKLICE